MDIDIIPMLPNSDYPVFSYSRLDLFDKCNYRYQLKYLLYADENVESQTLALEVGSICHKVLELKCRMIMNQEKVDYQYLIPILYEGIQETTDKGRELILGVNDLKKKYFDEWFVVDPKSGMNYEQKIELFVNKSLPLSIPTEDEYPKACEQYFSFLYKNKIIIQGYIDRVDDTPDGLRVVDYKTSRSTYSQRDLTTPLQMVIYGLACNILYKQYPTQFVYNFILLNKLQKACTKGWLERGIKKLDRIIKQLEQCKENNEFIPSPSPLCHWCDFCNTNNNALENYRNICNYYSLWTPNNKVFEVNQEWKTKKEEPIRKLVF